ENANEGTDSVEASANYTLPDQVENLTLVQGSTATSATGNGLANNLIGNSLANTLSGGGGNDVLFGLLGMDVLAGDGGNDTLHGGDDSDVLQGGAGNDTLNGGAGGDSAYGGADDDVLNGDAGSDHLYGDAGADRLNGGADHDQLFGGTENDVLNGDAGDDTLNGGQHNDTLDCGTGNDDLFGGSGADVLNGGDGDDSLLGEDDNDTLNGGAGADVLDGGGGADTLAGGLGDDTYIVDNTSDVVTEAAAAGTDTIVSSISFNLSADGPDANAVVDGLNVENLTLTGSATTGTGSSTNNVLTDSGGANTLVGLAGNDTYVYSGTLGVDDVAQDSAGIDNLTASVDTSLTPHIDGIESWYLRALASASLDFSASSGVNRLDLEVADGAVFELAATPILSGGIGLRGRPGGDYGSPSEFGTLDVRAAAAGALTFDLHGAGDSTRGISATLITTNSAQAISETLRLTDPTAFNQLDVSAVDGEVGITGDGHLRLVGLVPGSGGNSLLNTRLYVHNATLDLELAVASAIGDASVVDEALRLELEDASVALAIEPGLERLDLVSSGGAANSLNVGSPFGGVDPWEVLSPGYGTLLDAGLEFVITGIADLNLEHVRVKSVDAREFLGDLVMSIESEFGPFVNDEGTHLRAGNGVYTLFGGTHDDEFEMGGFLDHLDFISDAGVGDGDLLSATFNGFGSSAVAMPLYIHNIETLSIASTGSASAIDANAITGVTTINVQHSAGGDAALELQNVHATTVNAGGFTANLGVVFSDVGNHAAFGGDGHDTLTGGAGDDELSGGLGNDVLFGDQGADELVGGADNDSLNGGDGIDALSGGSGADTFVFDRDPGPTNFDVIEDFVSATDVLQLDDDIFTALAGLGSAPFALAAVNFRAAADGQATSATQFILYNTSSGGVFYDADGNGAGSALQFASLTGAPTLLHSDIFVIA
ncbi:MAG: calcium-binding protein, partial [Alphaproteobacteria bacterium]|nr:calcium-binding protein [Alphaproteobacteria bacterium]